MRLCPGSGGPVSWETTAAPSAAVVVRQALSYLTASESQKSLLVWGVADACTLM